MKSTLSLIIFCITWFACTAQSPDIPEDEQTYRKGELLVMLKHNAPADQFASQVSRSGFEIVQQISAALNIWLVSYDTIFMSGEAAKKMLSGNQYAEIVQFNHNNIEPKNSTPNDTLFPNQWDMSIISAQQAWDIDTGGFTSTGIPIVIATIDGGFDLAHPDLNMWHNAHEIPDNGIDDDHNGYIDDYRGWNYVWSNDSIPQGTGHGTKVMGISSAHTNNITGVAGMCWNVLAMAVVTDLTNEATVVGAYSYIFEERKQYNETNGTLGAFVVATNSSFGPAGYGYQYPLWNAMYDSMGSVGILSAGATSNTPGCDVDTCPDIPSQCASNFTVMVTSTDSNDIRRGAYGPLNVDLAAPGYGVFTISPDSSYGYFSGTSAASPHVAGAIALMWSAACPKMLDDYRLFPDSMALVMKRYLLEDGVDTIPALIGLTVSGGRLNLYKALQKVQAYDCTTTTGISAVPAKNEDAVEIYPNPANDKLYIKSTSALISVKAYNSTGQEVIAEIQNNTISLENFAPGIYTVIVLDQNGSSKIQKVVRE